MKRFKATIVEVGGACLHPEFIGDDSTTKSDMIKFWGLDKPDVISYDIVEERI